MRGGTLDGPLRLQAIGWREPVVPRRKLTDIGLDEFDTGAIGTHPRIAMSSPIWALSYSLPTTWASTCDIWSCGLNSTILTASSTTTV